MNRRTARPPQSGWRWRPLLATPSRLSFSSACVMRNQFAASSVLPMIEDMLAARQPLASGDVAALLTSVQPHVTVVLKDGEVARGDDTDASDGTFEAPISLGNRPTEEWRRWFSSSVAATSSNRWAPTCASHCRNGSAFGRARSGDTQHGFHVGGVGGAYSCHRRRAFQLFTFCEDFSKSLVFG